MKTVYCIALEGNAVIGSDWYNTREDREEWKGKTGAEQEIYFTMDVPDDADDDKITDLVGDAAWDKAYIVET